MQGLSFPVSAPWPHRTVWSRPPAAPLHPSRCSAPPEPAGIALPLSANPMMDFKSISFLPPCFLPFMHFPPIPLFCIFVSFTTSLIHSSFTSDFFPPSSHFSFSGCLSTPLISPAAISAAPELSPEPAASSWHRSRAVLAQEPCGCLSFRTHHSRAV